MRECLGPDNIDKVGLVLVRSVLAGVELLLIHALEVKLGLLKVPDRPSI